MADLDPALKDKALDVGGALVKAADSDGDGKPDAEGMKRLFMKDGEFSKTSAILVAAWAVGLSMWVVQSLAHGASVLGHTIPTFDSGSALAMLGAASSLYFAVHGIKVNVGQRADT